MHHSDCDCDCCKDKWLAFQDAAWDYEGHERAIKDLHKMKKEVERMVLAAHPGVKKECAECHEVAMHDEGDYICQWCRAKII